MNKRVTSTDNLKFLTQKRWLSLLGMLAMALILNLSGPSASAQVALGSMVGNVTDASVGAVPAAAVKVTQTQTNDVRTTTTNDGGTYNHAA